MLMKVTHSNGANISYLCLPEKVFERGMLCYF